MANFDILSLRTIFEDQNVMICFNGPFSHSVIEQLGEAVKNYLRSSEAPKDRIADVFSVFVEQAQNLKNYTTRTDLQSVQHSSGAGGTLAIAHEGENYIVSSGNLVQSEDVARIRRYIDPLLEADKGELKRMYKQRLREPVEQEEGAGLGFISMARKAVEPLRYSIKEQPDGTMFFNISVVI
ncbi:MAG: SiaB family protein kinase [Spirochaetota bacterium]